MASLFPIGRVAFQPIVDVETRRVVMQEALLRGPAGEPAGWVLGRVPPRAMHGFDAVCRARAVEAASSLELCQMLLTLNVAPQSLADPAGCLRQLRATLFDHGLHPRDTLLELSEEEGAPACPILARFAAIARAEGYLVALDDFGAGSSGLVRLLACRPSHIKLDRELLRGVDHDPARAAIIRSTLTFAAELGIEVIAEGVETQEEYQLLHRLGIRLFQGYLFARPALEAFPPISWPEDG
jgi:EAL domain-containing protein (putative c-di-GMP-specific phosphodiesterase class I)